MKIIVDDLALNWFKKEVMLEGVQGIRIFGKVYGKTNIHDNFSVGITIDEPELNRCHTKKKIGGVYFFVDKNDDWFFEDCNLHIKYNEKLDEPIYDFELK